MNKKSDFVDYAKGISIVGIVLFHLISTYSNAPAIIKTASNFGGAGVHIFLICSGFGLYYSHLNKNMKFSEFMKKRFLRVYVPYIIVVLVSFFVPFMYGGSDRIEALLSHIFLYKMFINDYVMSFGGQLWFVSTIFQFYFVFYLLVKLKNMLGTKKYLFMACSVSVIWWFILAILQVSEYRVWNSFFLQYLWEFALGMCLAEKYKENGKLRFINVNIVKLTVITCISMGIFAAMALSNGVFKVFNDIFSVLAFGGCILLIYRMKVINKLFIWINKFSYELYLLHILIMTSCFKIIGNILPNPVVCVIAFATSIIAGYLYHYLIILVGKRN